MESLAIAYVLNCKQEKMKTLSPKMILEKENLEMEIAKLHKLYAEALENY